jgi:hypothetical protein
MGRLPKQGSVAVDSTAPPEAIWAVLADVTRTGEWSHETVGGAWLGSATTAAPGVRFRGSNRQGRTRWSRVCEVLTADRPRTFSFRTVPSRIYPDSTIWTFELTPQDGGTRVTQRFEVVRLNPLLDRLFYACIPAHRDRTAALEADLHRLVGAAEGADAVAQRT